MSTKEGACSLDVREQYRGPGETLVTALGQRMKPLPRPWICSQGFSHVEVAAPAFATRNSRRVSSDDGLPGSHEPGGRIVAGQRRPGLVRSDPHESRESPGSGNQMESDTLTAGEEINVPRTAGLGSGRCASSRLGGGRTSGSRRTPAGPNPGNRHRQQKRRLQLPYHRLLGGSSATAQKFGHCSGSPAKRTRLGRRPQPNLRPHRGLTRAALWPAWSG